MIYSTEKYEKTKNYVEKTTIMPHINHMTTSDGGKWQGTLFDMAYKSRISN